MTGKRLDGASGFVEVKPDSKKNDTLKTHEDLLRLSLFGINSLEEYDAKCVFLSQVIGKVKLNLKFTIIAYINVTLQ